MTKSDFRATKSLAADLIRVEESLIANNKLLQKSFDNIKSKVSELNTTIIANVIQFRDSITSITTAIRDTLDNLENDLTRLDGIDLFEFKNSPDDLILNLRKTTEQINSLDVKIEDNLKIITKSKGKNDLFRDEIDAANKEVHELLFSGQKSLDIIDQSIKLLLDEIHRFKTHSKDLLQHKIL